eukprot:3859195-Prymnesium_polylepis.1
MRTATPQLTGVRAPVRAQAHRRTQRGGGCVCAAGLRPAPSREAARGDGGGAGDGERRGVAAAVLATAHQRRDAPTGERPYCAPHDGRAGEVGLEQVALLVADARGELGVAQPLHRLRALLMPRRAQLDAESARRRECRRRERQSAGGGAEVDEEVGRCELQQREEPARALLAQLRPRDRVPARPEVLKVLADLRVVRPRVLVRQPVGAAHPLLDRAVRARQKVAQPVGLERHRRPVVLQQPQAISDHPARALRRSRVVHGGIEEAESVLLDGHAREARRLKLWCGCGHRCLRAGTHPHGVQDAPHGSKEEYEVGHVASAIQSLEPTEKPLFRFEKTTFRWLPAPTPHNLQAERTISVRAVTQSPFRDVILQLERLLLLDNLLQACDVRTRAGCVEVTRATRGVSGQCRRRKTRVSVPGACALAAHGSAS